MTDEELANKAEIYLDKKYLKNMGVRNPCKEAYLAGAKEMKEENEQLKQQISGLENDLRVARKDRLKK